MTDERYVYEQDIREKKSAGYGAFHKKNESKSKKCSFPSDFMTRKEKNKMNGIVTTLNLKYFYTWEEFKKMSTDFQVEYLQSLADNYTVGVDAIASVVFGVSGQTLTNLLVKEKINGKVTFRGVRGSKVNKMNLCNAVNEQRNIRNEPEEQPVQEEASQETVEVKEEKNISTVLKSTIEMTGFDMNMIELMKNMYGDSEIRVTITVERL